MKLVRWHEAAGDELLNEIGYLEISEREMLCGLSALEEQAGKKGEIIMARKEKIDFSEIPAWTRADFKRARPITPAEVEAGRKAIEAKLGVKRPRRGRPSMGPMKARDIHLRIPPGVLERLRVKANKYGIGYQTLINEILNRAV